jgi:ABC-type multidrug transport system ATPase subunit
MTPLLALEEVSVRFRRGPQEIPVLRDVSLELNPGETIGIWGTRRSGKTTLANVAAGLLRPQHGRVLIDGYEPTIPKRWAGPRVHEHVSLVHCGGPKGPPDRRAVVDHIARGLQKSRHISRYERGERRRTLREARNVLELHELTDYADEPWGALAHRERVLVAIAEALISRPRILILDDFGLGIDLRQRDHLRTVLRDVAAASGLGILLTTDSISDLMGAQVAALSDGELMHPDRQVAQVIDFPAKKRTA